MAPVPRLSRRPVASPYMAWAKTRAAARFHLATSSVAPVGPDEFPLPTDGTAFTGPSFYGWPPLQEALAAFLGAPAGRIVHSAGTSLANHLALAVLADPGDAVLVEEPSYELIPETARFLGLEVVRFRRGLPHASLPDPDALERLFTPRTRVVAVTNLHNPTSAALDAARLRALAGLAARHGAWLLVDEVYRDSSFADPVPSAWDLAPNVVVTGSLTKVYGLPGLRCGWIVAPAEVADAAWRLTDLFHVIPSHTAEQQSAAALGRIGELRERTRRLLGANHALLNAFLAAHPVLDCPPAVAGTVAFPRLRTGPADALVRHLRERHETSVVPGGFFGMPDHFRIGTGAPTPVLSEGLDRLGRALAELGLH